MDRKKDLSSALRDCRKSENSKAHYLEKQAARIKEKEKIIADLRERIQYQDLTLGLKQEIIDCAVSRCMEALGLIKNIGLLRMVDMLALHKEKNP